MIIKGKVTSKERFFSLLHALAESAKTGTLVVVEGDVERRLYFEEGKIVSTASSTSIESFGHFLLERAFIQESTLSQLQSKPDALLGQELVELGAMSEDEVQQALRLKIKSTITDIYSSPEGKFEFANDRLPDKKRVSVAFDVLQLISDEGATEAAAEAREFRADTEQTDRFQAVRDEAFEERTDKHESAKDDAFEERTDKYEAVKDGAFEERTDKYEAVKDNALEERTDKYEPVKNEVVEDRTDEYQVVSDESQKHEAVAPESKSTASDSPVKDGEDSLLDAFERIKKIKSAKSRTESKESALPLIPVPTGPIRKSRKAEPEEKTPPDTEATIAEAPTPVASTPSKVVEKPEEEPPAPAPVEPEDVSTVEEDVPVVIEDEVEDEVPVVVEEEVEDHLEDEVPVVAEDEVEDDVSVVVEDEDFSRDSGDTLPGDIAIVEEERPQEQVEVEVSSDTESTLREQPESVSPDLDVVAEETEEKSEPVVAEPPVEEPKIAESVMVRADTESTLLEEREDISAQLPDVIKEPGERAAAPVTAESTVEDADIASASTDTESVSTEESSAKLRELFKEVQEEAPSPGILEPTISETAVDEPIAPVPEIPKPEAPKPKAPREPRVSTPIAQPGQVVPRQDSSKLPLVGAALIAVVLLSLGGYWFLGRSGEEAGEDRSRAVTASADAAEEGSQVVDSGADQPETTPSQPARVTQQATPPPKRAPAERVSEPVSREVRRPPETPARTQPQEPPTSRQVVEPAETTPPPPTEETSSGSGATVDQTPPAVDEGGSAEPVPSEPVPEPEPPPAAKAAEPSSTPPAKPGNNAGQQQPASSGWGNAIFAPQPKINVAAKNDQPTVERGALVEPGSDVIDPVLMEHPELKYPKEAKKQKIETVVQVRVLVDENGNVVDAKIDKPAGYGLDEAALKVARKARFMPATKGSVQVKMWTTLPLAYRLK